MEDRALRKRVMYAEHYNIGTDFKKELHSRPPIEARCDNCIYHMVNECPDCAGTNRNPIPRAEVINCR